MTRSHANKATFSPPFLHPPSPSTATNMTPPTMDHTGEARGHRRRHTVGVQGTPAIFISYLLFHLLRLDPQQPQHVPLPHFEHFLVLAHLSSPLPVLNTSSLPLPRLQHQNKPTRAHSGAHAPPLSLSLILNTSSLSLPHLEHQNEPTR